MTITDTQAEGWYPDGRIDFLHQWETLHSKTPGQEL